MHVHLVTSRKILIRLFFKTYILYLTRFPIYATKEIFWESVELTKKGLFCQDLLLFKFFSSI